MDTIRTNQIEKTKAAVAQIEDLFQVHPQSYLWIYNYSITHSVLTLIVHQGNHFDGLKVVCGGCDYLSGPLQGGPYNLTLRYKPESLDDFPQIEILGNENELVIICNRISMPTPFQIDPSKTNGEIPVEINTRLAQLSKQIEPPTVQN
ncbi:MAG: hypothetical protein AAF702_32565 [Chloroflexota bacterium]